MSTVEEGIMIGASRLRNLLHRHMEGHFREHGLTSAQFSVLEALYAKGDLSVGDIQEAMLGTPGNVPVIINNLARDGFVTKYPGEKDRRVSMVRLTDRGRELMAGLYPHPHQEWLEEVLEPLSAQDRQDLAHLLARCVRKLR